MPTYNGRDGRTGRTSAECAEIAAVFLPSTDSEVHCLLASLLEAPCAFLTAKVHVRTVEMSSEEIASHIKESFMLPNSRRLPVQPTDHSSLHKNRLVQI